MHPRLAEALVGSEGAATRAALLKVVTRHALAHAVTVGELVRLHPEVYVDARHRDDLKTRLRAALLYAGAQAAFSHTTGLALWEVDAPRTEVVHLVVPVAVQRRSGDRLLVHRCHDFQHGAPFVVERQGLPVVRLERCLVDAWPLLPSGSERRRPVIDAVRSRRTTAARLRLALDEVPGLRDRSALRQLVDLLDAGCQSELELWGHERVFTGPGFTGAERQYRVVLNGQTAYFDLAFADVKVAVELDGAAWHGSPEQRERDLRRDAAAAAEGWLVLRYSHRRLHSEPQVVKREALDVLARRRGEQRAA